MKKFLALIFISTSILHAMEERPGEEKREVTTVNQAVQLWNFLGNEGEPTLKFLTALKIIKPSSAAIKWAQLTQECKEYLLDLQYMLGAKLISLLMKDKLSKIDVQNAKLLIQTGADLNRQNSSDTGRLRHATPLIIAAFRNQKKIVKWLINAGAHLNMRSAQGYTALTGALGAHHTAIVELLIKAGSDINSSDKGYRTALMWAAAFGNKQGVKLLIQAGVDVNIRNESGETALILAIMNDPRYDVANNRKVIKLLIDAGSDSDSKNNNGNTAIQFAVFLGKKNIVELLIYAGASLNTSTENMTALDFATSVGDQEIINLLRNNGAVSGWFPGRFCAIC